MSAERLERLLGACPWGIFLVNPAYVDEHAMRHLRPGRILAVDNVHDAVRFIPTGDNPMLDCVAGWISDEDEGEFS